MNASYVILATDHARWRIGVVRDGDTTFTNVNVRPNATPKETAGDVAAVLTRNAYSGEGTLLAVPSAWCLSARISTAQLPKNDRKAMLYRLEEKLPLEAEKLIADFLPDAGAN